MPTFITMLPSPFCFAPDCSSSLNWPSGKSRPERTTSDVTKCMASGNRNVRRQARSIFLLVAAIMMLNTTGVRAFVTPPPRLPQPAAVALAAPTSADPDATPEECRDLQRDVEPQSGALPRCWRFS